MKKQIKEPELEMEDALEYASDSIDLETLEGVDAEDSYEQRAQLSDTSALLDDPEGAAWTDPEIPDWYETGDDEE